MQQAECSGAAQFSRDELEQLGYLARHDIKAPLRALRTLPQWIRETLDEQGGWVSPEVEVDLAEIEVQTRRLTHLVEGLIGYIQAGWNDPLQKADAFSCAMRAYENFDANSFELVLEGESSECAVHEAGLEAIFSEMICNSIKHSNAGTGRIQISGRKSGKFAMFDLCDSGPGIAPQYADRVFNPSTTLNPKDKLEGAGMGLAIARKIARSHGGDLVLLESGISSGATFRLSLPLVTVT